MKKLLFISFLLTSCLCSYSQFHIGDSPEQCMVDVLQQKNYSEPKILNSYPKCVYWEDNLSNQYFASFKDDRKIFKLSIAIGNRDVFNVFVQEYNKTYLLNSANEWLAAVENKAYLKNK